MKFLSVLVLAILAAACSSVEKKTIGKNTAAVEESVQRHPAMVIDRNDIPLASVTLSARILSDVTEDGLEKAKSKLLLLLRDRCIKREDKYKKEAKKNNERVFSDLSVDQNAIDVTGGDGENGYATHAYYNTDDAEYKVEVDTGAGSSYELINLKEAEKRGFKAEVLVDVMCTTYKTYDGA